MNLAELEAKVNSLEEKVRTFEDIEQIKVLQRAYGYYVDNLMPEAIADLFADDGRMEIKSHITIGKEHIGKSFRATMFKRPEDGTKKLYVHLQLQGIVHVDKGGQTAKGRWNMISFGTDYLGKPPGELEPIISQGVYENEYVKEKGVWKISKLTYNGSFQCTLQEGWVKGKKPERTLAYMQTKPDITLDIGDRTWRSGYKVPCHFKNPVTGK